MSSDRGTSRELAAFGRAVRQSRERHGMSVSELSRREQAAKRAHNVATPQRLHRSRGC
jgi:hypothetical protein